MPYRQSGDVSKPYPQIYVADWQTDEILATITNKEGVSAFFDDIHEIDAGESIETFEFSTLTDFEATQHLRKMNRVIIPGEDGDFREFIIDEVEQDSSGLVTVRTIASYMEMRKESIVPPLTENSATILSVLENVIANTTWELNKVEYVGTATVEWREYTNAFSAVKAILEAFKAEADFKVTVKGNRITKRYMDVRERVSVETGKEVVLGKDLERIKRIEVMSDVYTSLTVVGPEEDDGFRLSVVVSDEDALKRWGRNGRHLVGLYEPDIPEGTEVTEGLLESLGRDALDQSVSQKVKYEADAISIEYLFGRSHEAVRINDVVRVKDDSFNPPLYLNARVIKMSRKVSDVTRKTFELGDFVDYDEFSITRNISRLYERIQNRPNRAEVIERDNQVKADAVSESEEYTDSKIQEADQQITELSESLSSAQSIIDSVTGEKDGLTVLEGTLVTNNIIAENATLSGTLLGDEAVINDLTVNDLTAIGGTFEDISVKGSIDGSVATIIDLTTFNMKAEYLLAEDVLIERGIIRDLSLTNVTVSGTLDAVTGTFSGDVQTDENIRIGRDLYLGEFTNTVDPRHIYFNEGISISSDGVDMGINARRLGITSLGSFGFQSGGETYPGKNSFIYTDPQYEGGEITYSADQGHVFEGGVEGGDVTVNTDMVVNGNLTVDGDVSGQVLTNPFSQNLEFYQDNNTERIVVRRDGQVIGSLVWNS